MLQPLGVVLIFASAGAVIVSVATTLFERRGVQIAVGAIAGACVGGVIDATLSGAVAKSPLVLLALFVVPFVVAGVALAVVPQARERLLGVPRRLILGVNIFRVFGFLFLGLASAGQLAGPFPYFAGIGDIIVGLGAIPLALGESNLSRNDGRLVLWNVLGLLDLVTAVTLGLTSANGSPLQLIHSGAGSAAMTQFPWSLIPAFLVPCYMIGHFIIFAQMRATSRSAQYAHA